MMILFKSSYSGYSRKRFRNFRNEFYRSPSKDRDTMLTRNRIHCRLFPVTVSLSCSFRRTFNPIIFH